MKLAILAEGKHTVCAYLETSEDEEGRTIIKECPFFADVTSLSKANKKYRSDCEKLMEVIDNYAAAGTSRLPPEQFKSVTSPTNDIFELKRGRVRAYCFKYDDDNIIILTCCVLKRDQPDKSKIRKARSLHDQYDADKLNGLIELTKLDD